jgi:hypothetical protein
MKAYLQLLLKKIMRISRDKMETLFTGKLTLGVLYGRITRETVAREGDSVH